ncbi:monooxygenase [Blastopirellula marina]|uniref:Monooxygenase n=1 Tax=Blastopirellula marina TaxID=124 RepID=A0A2S8FY56_9BACT|nr:MULTISPECIES: NAD(P)-binding domain-containing protein [Pirellulaceae]PQO37000.1 monooxygenase [Blastopirellula marina]RCS53715.1 NAD(P)/FAD-dependent oxidoreductase [Bremerella cremea]
MTSQHEFRVLVIGAGPSGLVALKNLRQIGIDTVAVDRNVGIGGNWDIRSPHSSVYESTHLISSKGMTQFFDCPMPEEYPEYPSHREVLAYLHFYAERFELDRYVRKNTSVVSLKKGDSSWQIELREEGSSQSTTESFAAVVIANGHHAEPMMPTIAGQFAGESLHAHSYKHHRQLEGKRVLVVGAGNSGCDIAVEAAIHGQSAAISMRRGYHFFPKFIRGKPADVVGDRVRRWPIPRAWQQRLSQFVVDWTIGKPQRYGLPKPEHGLFDAHPIINSQLPYYAGHGKLKVFPDVRSWDGESIEFTDGRREAFDMVVFATGYQLVFPFIEDDLLNSHNGVPKLYLHAFHPTDDTLFVAGMIQPNSGQWQLTDLQTQIIARFLKAKQEGREVAQRFREQKQAGGIGLSSRDHFLATTRHQLEVDYFDYRRTLTKIVRQFD